tara:strand:+ start:2900 stop:3361 length:462 start_codon:yes stop_codon:yes gene_type:complete
MQLPPELMAMMAQSPPPRSEPRCEVSIDEAQRLFDVVFDLKERDFQCAQKQAEEHFMKALRHINRSSGSKRTTLLKEMLVHLEDAEEGLTDAILQFQIKEKVKKAQKEMGVDSIIDGIVKEAEAETGLRLKRGDEEEAEPKKRTVGFGLAPKQ